MACAAQYGVIHGSLTLRHCKLSSRNHIKVSGFDLYFNYCDAELFEEARQHKQLPLKVGVGKGGRCLLLATKLRSSSPPILPA